MTARTRAATPADVAAICEICPAACRDTYAGLLAADHTERVIAD
jgi:hypothetical protein